MIEKQSMNVFKEMLWSQILDFKEAVSLKNVTQFILGITKDGGIVVVDSQEQQQYDFLISDQKLEFEGFVTEALFNDCIYFYYRSFADLEIVDFLRDYWALLTYMKRSEDDQLFVLIHMAQSLDGKVCTVNGHSKWIGNQENLVHAHRLRALVDGVLVGGNTAQSDLPKLTVRHVKGSNPIRIIYSDRFDGYDQLDKAAQQKTINVRTSGKASDPKKVISDYIYYDQDADNYLSNILESLSEKGLKTILVEGGPTTTSSLLMAGLVDVLQIHIAPIVVGSGKSSIQLREIFDIGDATQLENAFYSKVGDSQMITGIPNHKKPALASNDTLRSFAHAPIPTEFGVFDTVAYAENEQEQMPHLALINPDTDFAKTVNVRIHSECMTGDVFGSRRCECGEQLKMSMKYVSDHGGLIIYLRQEGRGIGIINKLHAYTKQDQGFNTADANKLLGFGYDDRTYQDAISILDDLGINNINLLTNNMAKIEAIEAANIEVCERIPVEAVPRAENMSYLQTKKDFFGHKLSKI